MKFGEYFVHFFINGGFDFSWIEEKEGFLQWEFVLLTGRWGWAYVGAAVG
jgi:hypothetical protein